MANIFLEVPLEITQHQGRPTIVMRKFITDPVIHKALITATLNNTPIQIKPVFRKPHVQIGNAISKGMIKRNKDQTISFIDY